MHFGAQGRLSAISLSCTKAVLYLRPARTYSNRRRDREHCFTAKETEMEWSDERMAPDPQPAVAFCTSRIQLFAGSGRNITSVLPNAWQAQVRDAYVDARGGAI